MKRPSQILKDAGHCCVLGAGISGVAAAKLLRRHDCRVTVLDCAPPENLGPAVAELARVGAQLKPRWQDVPGPPCDLCIASPGFALDHPWLRACHERNIPVMGELELGYLFWPHPILAVTGSKGKSSIVKLCADTLSAAGIRALPAGNYGYPLSELTLWRDPPAWAIVEVSSFQLETVFEFRPRIGILLNLLPDHLDRHGSMEQYASVKMKLFARQQAGDHAMVPAESNIVRSLPSGVTPLTFGTAVEADWRYRSGMITGKLGATRHQIDLRDTEFDNSVLGPAAAAAAAALAAIGLADADIARGLRAFRPLPHRMSLVAEHHGIRFIDDSKGTSLAALGAALRMTRGPVRLIAGGRLKEQNLDSVKELLTNRVQKGYLIGESARKLHAAWHDCVACEVCGDLATAVKSAAGEADAGEAILLSPGCASFDQFKNFEERGKRFAEAVRETISAGAVGGSRTAQEKSE